MGNFIICKAGSGSVCAILLCTMESIVPLTETIPGKMAQGHMAQIPVKAGG